ncbi:FIG00444893: hypothetical protein [hydrothermal vent metagenome]|uniref:Cytochrome c oxidase, subunit I n=1 Tax=hydrothermal vent metagenome TaxID=652676 RepID=A0A3B0TXI3_9ZZZZ
MNKDESATQNEPQAGAEDTAGGSLKGARKPIEIRTITSGDVIDAIGDGVMDLARAPLYGFAFGGFYAAFGWILLAAIFYFNFDLYAFPLATGFALIAPFVAAGCYEVSRRLEAGEPLRWGPVLGIVRRGGRNDLNWMVVVTVFAYIIWIDIAMALYVIFFGLNPLSLPELVIAVFTTLPGVVFFIIGSLVGAVLSVVVFSITAISFPILFERNIDFVTAMITSVRAVKANPGAMAFWGVTIGLALGISILSAFVALIVVLPVFGHTTWHLYRRLIGPPDKDEA